MIKSSSAARMNYSREEFLRLQHRVTTPPDVPHEIQKREYERSSTSLMTNGRGSAREDVSLHKAANVWRPSLRRDRVEDHPTASCQHTVVHGMEDVELRKAENAWRPSTRKVKVDEDPEETVTQDLLRRMRSILNKLTPEKFERLMKQVMELSINTETRLEGVGELIFEKAITETKFARTYAELCNCLKELTVPCSDPALFLNFRLLILDLCRKEFWRVTGEGVTLEKKWKALNAADMDEGQHLKEELEAKITAHRRRAVGCMKFLGELYKLGMVRDAVIRGCISTFLNIQTEEALECLCSLLTTTGAVLDSANVKVQMNEFFQKMRSILEEGRMTSRVRFLMRDLIELRQNNWLPRRAEQGPETLKQIHEAAELEQQRDAIKVAERQSTTPVTSSSNWNLRGNSMQ